jgi:hypothetical protein
MPTYSTIRKAAAPITGGISWPLTELATSTAPALALENPVRFISGTVKVPVVTTLAMEEPETTPVSPEATTAAFAGPPRRCPSSEKATRMK